MTQGTKGIQSKNKLIECAACLFLQKGYHATGINEILACSGLPKGSFYFHFESKKDLAMQVAVYYDKKINDWIAKTAKEKNWEVFITDLMAQMLKDAENKKHLGCPLAVLGLEIAFSEPDMAAHYTLSMGKLIDTFTKVFVFSGIPVHGAGVIANRAFAVFEGYLLYYRISKDIEVLRMLQRDLTAIYKTYEGVEA